MNIHLHKTGWVEVICGSMFSGKTEELIRRIHRVEYAKQKILVFKPAIDNRYDNTAIVSHSRLQAPSIPITNISESMNTLNDDTEVVAIDRSPVF